MTGPMGARRGVGGAVDLSALAAPKPEPTPPPADGGPSIIEVSEPTFEADVIVRSERELVLLLLWARWSEPSVHLGQTMEQLAVAAGGAWTLALVDVDAAPRIPQAFGAQNVPMVIAMWNQQPVSAFDGAKEPAEIAAWIQDVAAQAGVPMASAAAELEPADDPRMVAAEELLNAGDTDAALAAYEAIATTDGPKSEAASAVRNIRFMVRAQQHDPSIISTAAADDVDGQLAAADVLLLGQRPEQAFDALINLVRLTDGDDRTRARTRLLELFDLFDPAEPFVVAARRKLATALY
ncbi:tetratricopeptide repeat protein [Gordonia malaquae]|uniref:tetratricopeptide repeat protein n=1 Tax=Gordonia malaquae TaxID=410332 RepID=UPI0030C79954